MAEVIAELKYEHIAVTYANRLKPGKTCTYSVHQSDSAWLGNIAWWAPLRQYAFVPAPDTVFDVKCMLDIVDAIRKINDAHDGRNSGLDDSLIRASNTLCDYVKEHMPEGYDLHLVMNSEEAYLELSDPDSENVDFSTDRHTSAIREACDCARELS